jgi:hypothetical protein
VEEGHTAETATVWYKEGIMTRVTKIPHQRTMRDPTVETATEEDHTVETATEEDHTVETATMEEDHTVETATMEEDLTVETATMEEDLTVETVMEEHKGILPKATKIPTRRTISMVEKATKETNIQPMGIKIPNHRSLFSSFAPPRTVQPTRQLYPRLYPRLSHWRLHGGLHRDLHGGLHRGLHRGLHLSRIVLKNLV